MNNTEALEGYIILHTTDSGEIEVPIHGNIFKYFPSDTLVVHYGLSHFVKETRDEIHALIAEAKKREHACFDDRAEDFLFREFDGLERMRLLWGKLMELEVSLSGSEDGYDEFWQSVKKDIE